MRVSDDVSIKFTATQAAYKLHHGGQLEKAWFTATQAAYKTFLNE